LDLLEALCRGGRAGVVVGVVELYESPVGGANLGVGSRRTHAEGLIGIRAPHGHAADDGSRV
jgi:hypothetical protein